MILCYRSRSTELKSDYSAFQRSIDYPREILQLIQLYFQYSRHSQKCGMYQENFSSTHSCINRHV